MAEIIKLKKDNYTSNLASYSKLLLLLVFLATHSQNTQENSRQPENSTHAGEINEDGERREELSARCLFLFWVTGV